MLNNNGCENTPSKEEGGIICFLNERKEKSFTSEEIMGGLGINIDFRNNETAKMSSFTIADFTALLYELARQEKVEMKFIDGRMHFFTSEKRFKCPKCKAKFAVPNKKWKMIRRPDNRGRKMELTIGLFKCPDHGYFRVAIEKKILVTNKRSNNSWS